MAGRGGSFLNERDLVAMIYEAALEDGLWPDVLKAISGRIGCDDVHFAVYDQIDQRQVLSGMSLIPLEANQEYTANYFPRDARVPRLRAAPPLQLLDDRALQTSEERRNSAFHHEFLPRYGIAFQLLSTLLNSERWFAVLVAGNSPGRGEFTKRQKQVLQPLLPHLQRALRLFLKGHVLASGLQVASEAIEKLTFAVLVLAPDFTVLHINGAGRALLRAKDGLAVRDNKLVIEDASAAKTLLRFLRGNGHFPEGPAEDRALVHRRSGQAPYHLRLHRLPRQPTVWSPSERAAVLVFVLDPHQQPRRLGATLMNLYGLTGAEACVAAAIVGGKTLAEYAEERRLSIETVRFQMKQVLEKTNTRRQTDLVRIIARSIAPIEPD